MTRDELTDTYAAMGRVLVSGAEACSVCRESTLRVGTDVQEIEVVAAALRDHAERYLERVFTAREVAAATEGNAKPQGAIGEVGVASLAARYAVKEAVIKALRPVDTGVPWPDIEVVRHPGGWCTLALHGLAERLADLSGLSQWTVSFAHDGDVAVATVMSRHKCGHDEPA